MTSDVQSAGHSPRSGLRRRELLAAGAAGAIVALDGRKGAFAAADRSRLVRRNRFASLGDGRGWGAGWRCTGAANLRRHRGLGLLEAGSDVYPNDPRPVAFPLDCRVRDAEITATLVETGAAPGVVLRRRSARAYYAALYDTTSGALRILRRFGFDLDELGAVPVPKLEPPVTLTLAVAEAGPVRLRAELVDARGRSVAATAEDSRTGLHRAGDPGVLSTAQTLFPGNRHAVLPALGNTRLLPWGVQEGQAVMATPGGQAIVDEIRRRSTVALAEVEVRALGRVRITTPSAVAAATGRPVAGGAELHVAADVPADVDIELSYSSRFRRPRMVRAGSTGRYTEATKVVRGLKPGRRVYWRASLRRAGTRSTGPVRSFRVPPARGSGEPFRIAVAACGAQFGPIFDDLAGRRPDVLVWQGDLNYPDTHGPLAQTVSGYAGIWRDFLANPVLTPILRDGAFAPQRDDHDYGLQDANSTNVASFPWGLRPWNALMSSRPFYRFPAGAAEVWVLDQRLFKSDPKEPDGTAKTLLGHRQRRWLLETLRASRAEFKVICSPCTVFMPANQRDGNWATGFAAEREIVLDHIRRRVGGTTLFLTGDTHLTGVYDDGDGFEARAAPIGIPKPNDITLTDPLAADKLRRRPGVSYAGDECHYTLLDLRGAGAEAALRLSLVREDGSVPYERLFRPS